MNTDIIEFIVKISSEDNLRLLHLIQDVNADEDETLHVKVRGSIVNAGTYIDYDFFSTEEGFQYFREKAEFAKSINKYERARH
jgi:hypothetical protein